MSGLLVAGITALVREGANKAGDTFGQHTESIPLTWHVDLANGQLCHHWTFPKQISELPYHQFSDMAQDDKWALSQGGVEKSTVLYTITVQSSSDTQVVIRDLRLKVLSTSSALSGITVIAHTGCGGGLTDRYYQGDLGSSDPRIILVDPSELGRPMATGVEPVDQSYTVSKTDSEVFAVFIFDSSSKENLFDYQFQLDWSQGNKSGTANILAPDNKPFQLNATAYSRTDPVYYSSDGSWQKFTR